MSIASLFRPAPAAVTGGRHAAPETEERPASAPAPDRGPGRHAAPEDVEPAFDAEVVADVDAGFDEDQDLLDSLGFAYAD